MKQLATIFAIFSLNIGSALAATITVDTFLPVLQNVKLVRSVGDGLATVQPTASVTFTYKSCAQRTFDIDVVEQDGTKYVSIKDIIGVDCFGPTTVREYSVQYSSDANTNEKVVILNPQSLESPNF